jgi:hypothetical protein
MVLKRSSPITDLAQRRSQLNAPTTLIAFLVEHTGAHIVTARPGLVEAVLDSGEKLSIRVSQENIYEGEALAYRLAGKPVPPHVFEDAARWNREHGKPLPRPRLTLGVVLNLKESIDRPACNRRSSVKHPGSGGNTV